MPVQVEERRLERTFTALLETFLGRSSWKTGGEGWLHFADEHSCLAFRISCPDSAALWAVCRQPLPYRIMEGLPVRLLRA
jgi:hypothetical protein